MKSSGGFEVHCCSFFVEIRTPVRRQGRVAAREFGCKCWVEWSAGNAMRHQRCAGCLAGKAEFPCGLPGDG